ncbi:MAG: lysine--tRNA ligase, partial [Patescibacteria group bacterium]|nr:lysine--tRNA ligase [Patescibacteria group bacterium]
MASLEELRATRLGKLELLRKAGMEAYPVSVPRDFSLKAARQRFADYEDGKGGPKAGASVSLCGRITAIRGQGAILFLVLDDGTATFQAVVKKDVLKADFFDLLTAAVDIGDVISVTGTLFTTQRGEPSLAVHSWAMAAKSLLPLPEKWHGLTDPDERFRKRYLDFIMDPATRELFYKKAAF